MSARANVLLCALALAGCSSPALVRPRTSPQTPSPTTSVVPDKQQATSVGEQIAKTRQELRELTLELRTTQPELYSALAVNPETLVARRADLPAGAVVIAYFVAADAIYAFVISAALPEPAVLRVKVTSSELTSTVLALREAVLAESEKLKQRDKAEDLGRRLDNWLLEPLRPFISDATTVVILPFGSLNYVPFDALVVSEAGQPLRYAIEDFRFSIQTGATFDRLLEPVRKQGHAGSMLAISNTNGAFPGAEREVARIIKSFPDARVLKKDGTIKAFNTLAGGYRFLHLATQCVIDNDPRKSYLQFTDGHITAPDITRLEGLDHANEMVVLSACAIATSGGDDANGLLSLATAFVFAGAPAVVASLWSVDDESTAELMSTFYKALESGGERLDALRNAKLSLLRMKRDTATVYAAPWYWAAFQMFGDFRAPKPQ